jgi:sugar lactone lactonase YvrE
MKHKKIFYTGLLLLITGFIYAQETSVYQERPNDSEAFYFTPENYNIKADGKMDVSDALQEAINQVKTEKNFGILFIPEGKYKVSRTIYVPGAIRLIGYGKNRPEIILGENTPGYQEEVKTDKGRSNYMIWFTGGIVSEGREPRDAGAGTFYSAVSNINFTIEDGNPQAIALRTHYAQHGFVSHVIINAGKGKAGLFDVGNEMENVKFYGGDYGIITNRTSPGWPMMMVDTYFEGQRKAAIQTNEAGLAIVSMHVKNTPVAIEMVKESVDRIFMENCLLEDVGQAGVIFTDEENSMSQLNMLNVDCKNVPVLVTFPKSGKNITGNGKMYKVKDFTHGLIMENIASDSEYNTIVEIEPLNEVPKQLEKDIPSLPAMETWINIKDLGAKGDGETDDTQVFQKAISSFQNIYVPQGWYRLTETLKLKKGTKLIGFHPFATQLLIVESEPAFSGFGSPQPLVESSEGGDDILNGIGINTGAYNYRAVGCKWMAGENSLMNDVKFVGGHGTMRKPDPSGEDRGGYRGGRGEREISAPGSPVYARGMDLAWDNQYWSLWVTNNGGGTIKDIWTANTYAASGLYVSNTSTPGRIMAMSLEHHVRNETRFANVSNWKMYAFQFEEEGLEGKDCLMGDISSCKNLMFVNQWMYRTIRVSTPQPVGVRVYNSENIEFRNMHNYTQKLQVVEFPVYEMNKKLPAYPWDYARLTITGNEPSKNQPKNQLWEPEKLASGFIFGTGLTSDSQGNVYFCEYDRKRIYKYSAGKGNLSLLTDHPWKPFTLATDTKDNLLVIYRYDPQPGYLVDGEQETVPQLADDNPMYSGWGNSGWAAWGYSIDPENPDETIKSLKRVPAGEIENVKKAVYPSSRWRFDFDEAIIYVPENYFVAPDGVTVIPETYDLGRSAALSEAVPGQPFYVTKEINKTTVKLDVAADGKISDMKQVVPRGEYSSVVDSNGNLYVADGQIFVYDKNYNEIRRISLEERPISIAFGGQNKNTLFVTTHNSLYGIRVK